MAEVAELVRRLIDKLEADHGPLASLYDPRPDGKRLLWPPANARLVANAGKQLGFSLPPLLVAVYREVGNGGSALRLMGVGVRSGQTGFLAGEWDVGYGDKDLVRGYFSNVEFTRLVLREKWPRGLVPIYDALGCGGVYYCDCTTPEGRVWEWDSPGSRPWIKRGLSIKYPSLAAYWAIA